MNEMSRSELRNLECSWPKQTLRSQKPPRRRFASRPGFNSESGPERPSRRGKDACKVPRGSPYSVVVRRSEACTATLGRAVSQGVPGGSSLVGETGGQVRQERSEERDGGRDQAQR